MYFHRGEVLCRNRRVSQICPYGNQGSLKRGILDLHRGSVLNRKKPNPAGLHQLLNRWIADCPYSEDSVCPSVQECVFRGLIICADKMKIRLMETKMFHYAEKGLKLSSALCQRDPLPSQIHQALYLRILGTNSWKVSS